MKKISLILVIIALFHFMSYGQSPYRTTVKKECIYGGVGIASVALGGYLNSQVTIFTQAELTTFDPQDINAFDRLAVNNFSEQSDHISDAFLYGSFASPLLLLSGKKTRSEFGQIMALYGEALFINTGITFITKSLFKRPRPFVFNEAVVDEFKLSRSARSSFISGHTSVTTVNTFFAAKVFADFYPDSPWKPVVWTLGAAIPAVTGYLRVAAGKHYPTDVIGGYAVGAVVGILIPHLHRNKKNKDTGLQLDLGPGSARLVWQFK